MRIVLHIGILTCVCGIMARMNKPIVATENCTAAANTERHVANAILSQSAAIIK